MSNREIIFYKNHFNEFYLEQNEKVRWKRIKQY